MSYQLLQVLGKGAHGTVYLAQDVTTQKQVVIKYFDKALHAERELAITRHLGCLHKNILCVLGPVENNGVVSEYISGAIELTYYPLPQTIAELLDIFYQLADGLEYMHRHQVAHGDVKIQNIVMKGHTPIYIDFSLSCFGSRDLSENFYCRREAGGTPNYQAPEIFQQRRDWPYAADVYSLGVVFYVLLAGKLPFSAPDLKEKVLKNLPSAIGSQFPDVEHLIYHMLQKEPILRPSAEELKDQLQRLLKEL